MKKVRIGFVGVGGMGQSAHLQNYISIPECEVVALAELRPQLAERVARRWDVKKTYPNHAEMLKHETLDGIVAIQPFGMHAKLVPELLEKRVPVITEKPLAESIESGEKIVAAVKRTNTPVYLAYHKRSDPATVFVKRQIDAWQATGEVGKLRYIRITMPPGNWMAEGHWQMLQTEETYESFWGIDSPYGRFVNFYIHQVNLFRHLFGDYEVLWADPGGLTMAVRSHSNVSGTLEMFTHKTSIEWQEKIFISFERAWIELKLPAPLAVNRAGSVTIFKDLGVGKGEPSCTQVTMPWIHAMRAQAQNFVRALQGETTPLCSAEDGLKDLQVAKRYIELFEQAQKTINP